MSFLKSINDYDGKKELCSLMSNAVAAASGVVAYLEFNPLSRVTRPCLSAHTVAAQRKPVFELL